MDAFPLLTMMENGMPPLTLIPIGLYAITATLRAELALENAGYSAKEPEQKVTLTETMVPKQAIDFAPKARANTSAFATTTELADPVVKENLCESA